MTPGNRILSTVRVLALLAAATILSRAEGPAVAVVTGPAAPPLEQRAASDLADLLERLFGATVTLTTEIPEDTPHLILVGSPATHPALAEIAGDDWPEDLGEQGHLLKSVSRDADTFLIVGGGSPAATYWAVSGFGYRFGMRYALHEDYPPVEAPEFTLTGLDEVFRPAIPVRAWLTLGDGPASQVSWGLEEHRRLLGQLAKLKFNRIILPIHPGQPFSNPDSGAPPSGGVGLWPGGELRVDGDTAGRSVFGGAKVFGNPDFAGTSTDAERLAAGSRLTAGIVAAARELGMTAVFEPAATPDLTLEPLFLAHPQGGLLPQSTSSRLPEKLAALRDTGKAGFAVQCWIPGPLTLDVHYLSRASFEPGLAPDRALADFVTPICGEGVAERLAAAFEALEEVSKLIAAEDPAFPVPGPDFFLRHYRTTYPAPEWWARASGLYATAMNEMYRGNTRAREGARPFLLYHAKTFTFAVHYFSAVTAARQAGLAKAAGDKDARVENLELAVEAMHNALGIYAEVARDNSDRGVIAVLNAHAYRPLLEELDAASAE